VRSQLEYSCIIWTPNTQKHAKVIEKIQCKFLKLLMYRKTTVDPAYVIRELLSNFNIQTLEQRRHLNDLIFLYKLIHNIDYIDLIPKIFIQVANTKTRLGNNGTYCLLCYVLNK